MKKLWKGFLIVMTALNFVVAAFLTSAFVDGLKLAIIHWPEKDLGAGYVHYRTKGCIDGNLEQVFIPREVVGSAYDDIYIVARQVVSYPDKKDSQEGFYPSDSSTYYWLIDKRTDEAIGPPDAYSFAAAISKMEFSPKITRTISRWGIHHE